LRSASTRACAAHARLCRDLDQRFPQVEGLALQLQRAGIDAAQIQRVVHGLVQVLGQVGQTGPVATLQVIQRAYTPVLGLCGHLHQAQRGRAQGLVQGRQKAGLPAAADGHLLAAGLQFGLAFTQGFGGLGGGLSQGLQFGLVGG